MKKTSKVLVLVLTAVVLLALMPTITSSVRVFGNTYIAMSESPSPTPSPTPLWDYWLTVRSSDAEQGLVRANSGEEVASINFHFHNTNPWPSGGITVEALPKKGFRFDGWYEGDELVGTENPYTFMGKHLNLVAKFSSSVSHAAPPKIITQPKAPKKVKQKAKMTLIVKAKAKGKLSYQWYSNKKRSPKGGKKISKATKASYKVPTKKKGTVYYYCVVTNKDNQATGKKTATATSKIVKVVVK